MRGSVANTVDLRLLDLLINLNTFIDELALKHLINVATYVSSFVGLRDQNELSDSGGFCSGPNKVGTYLNFRLQRLP